MARTTKSADRLLALFRDNARRVSDRGLSHLKIEDDVLTAGHITVDGRLVHNFGDCSYLGLGTDRRLAEGAKRAIDRFGSSYSSSIAYTAVPLYQDLKERFDRIMGAPVVLAPTTTLAHAAALPVLIRPGDVVLMDAAVHNSVQMSAQLLTAAGVEVHTAPHGDFGALDHMIDTAESGGATAIWYLADGVYSMSGAAAPFAAILDRLEAHPSLWAYIDDAHGFSWSGEHGRGLALDHMGWHHRLVISAGLAKGFGSAGGIVASLDPELVELVEVCGPTLTFGGPLPPATLGASIASADIHLSGEMTGLQTAMADRIALVNRTARTLGIPLSGEAATPIFFVAVGRVDVMMDVGAALLADGFYLNPAAWPAVPHRRAGLRFTVTNSLDLAAIEEMLGRLQHHLAAAGVLERTVIDLTDDAPMVDLS